MMSQSLSRGDTLSGLLRLVKDPKAVEAEIAKIQKAEDDYKAAVSEGNKVIAAKRAEIASTASAQDARAAALAKRETEVAAREKELGIKAAALSAESDKFKAFEAATTAKLADQEQGIKDARATLMKDQTAFAAAKAKQDKREADQDVWDKELKFAEIALNKRDKLLSDAENAHAKKAATLKAALGAAA